MLTVRWQGLKKLERDLKETKAKAVPYAVRNLLNTAAFEARKVWQGHIKAEFTNRSPYTVRSIRVDKATGTNVDRMKSVTGSVADYMFEQEQGGVARGRSGKRPIPAPGAAGQTPGNRRTRIVRAGFKLGAINLPSIKGSSPKQRNAVALALAIKHRQQFALLERPGGGRGIFRVIGGRRTWAKKRWRTTQLKTRLLWDLSRSSARIPATHMLGRTLKAITPKLPHMGEVAFVEQLRRHRALGY
jgi:hypothetical protein